MCTGLELALMGAGMAGNVISANESRKQQDAMVSASNDRLNQFLDRNKQRSDEAASLFAERQHASEEPQASAERADATQGRETRMTDTINTLAPSAAPPLKGSAESVIGGVYADESAKGTEAAKSKAKALAKTSGVTDALFGQDLATTEIGRKIGTIGGLASADAAMLPQYQELASGAAAARKRPSGIGGLLSGLGTAGGYYVGGRG